MECGCNVNHVLATRLPTDTRNTFDPELAVDLSPQDYRSNRDPVLEAILNYVPRPALEDELFHLIQTEGIQAAVTRYRNYVSDPLHAYHRTLGPMNRLGYRLLGQDLLDAAVAIFALNADAYPDSWVVFDSLAESLMKNGDAESAIANYQRSLSLNPANGFAREMIAEMLGQ